MGFCVTGLGRGQPERVVWRRGPGDQSRAQAQRETHNS